MRLLMLILRLKRTVSLLLLLMLGLCGEVIRDWRRMQGKRQRCMMIAAVDGWHGQ